MKQGQDLKTVKPYPRSRLLMVDGGRMGVRKHTIHGLAAFDVTRARAILRQQKAQTGEALSFSAFILACLGEAINQDKAMHAYRNWRNQLIIFDEVDANMLFEVEVDGKKMIRPHILRGINKKSLREIHQEIRAYQKQYGERREGREGKFIERFVRLPAFLRRFFLWAMFQNPGWIKDTYGTVLVTSLGMFGTGGGWGIPVPNHSLQLTLGGIDERPGVVQGRVEVREFLSVTVSFDHDVIDGAPAARFTQRLKELVEGAYGLEQAGNAGEGGKNFLCRSHRPAGERVE